MPKERKQGRNIASERSEIEGAVEGKTLCMALAETAARHGDLEALKWKSEAGWEALTWRQYREQVRDFSLGLRALGFAPGSFGVVLTVNRPEHVIATHGLIHAGGTPAGLYRALAPTQIAHIANHCGARVAVVDSELLERLSSIRSELPKLETVILIGGDPAADPHAVIGWNEVLELGRAEHERDAYAFEAMAVSVKPEDLASLIYTSGTSGPPKAVMITHRNALWTVESYGRFCRALPEDRLISFLPLAHVSEQYLTLWQSLVCGTTTHFCPDAAQLVPTLLEVRPTWFCGVPRIWERLYAGIKTAVASQEGQVRSVAEWEIETGQEVVASQQEGREIGPGLAADHEALRSVRAAVIGKVWLDECRLPIVTGAPSNPDVLRFFHALGLPIVELFGMTELSGPATCNPPKRVKIGTVGPTLPGVEARIAPDGELLVRGGSVTLGYYCDAIETAKAIDDDGWLHTGDVAIVDEDGYFRIVDRKKELIITSFGKNISPANLEALLKQHPLVGQACVVGNGRPDIAALVVLDPQVAPGWAKANSVDSASLEELSRHPKVSAQIRSAIHQVNRHVSGAEQILRFTVLPAAWTSETGELTPTFKLKRRVIEQRYTNEIAAMYGGEPISRTKNTW